VDVCWCRRSYGRIATSIFSWHHESVGTGFVIVMPLIYLVELKLLSARTNFGVLVLIIASLFSVLGIVYFWGSWGYGVKYQGEVHTRIVAAENIVGFIILFALAYLGMRRKSKVLQYSANLFLFLLLSWCAFPYLAELA